MLTKYMDRVKNSEKIFISMGENGDLSYSESYDKMEKITSLFHQLNIGEDDNIVIISGRDVETSLLFLASLLNGITVSIVDSEIKSEKLNNILTLLKPKMIFIDDELITMLNKNFKFPIFSISDEKEKSLKKFLHKIPLFSKKKYFYNEINALLKSPMNFKSDLNKTAYILFTSGTSSSPKGVEITYRSLFNHLKTLQKVYSLDQNSKIMNILELSHADGMIQGPVLAWFSNSTLYRPFKFRINKIEELLTLIHIQKITHFITVPTMLSLIYKLGESFRHHIKESNLHSISSAGALLDPILWKNFQKSFSKSIINVYGLTESVVGGLFTELGNSNHIGTVGKPIDCQAKIVNDLNQEVSDGEVGEVLLYGSNIMKGYYENPEATENIIKDGWLYTGDLATREEGIYKIVGRKKDIILTGGFTVYPEEIIELLNAHNEIVEATAFGLENGIWGEEIVIAIVKKRVLSLSEIDILEYCREHLESYKIPKKVIFLDSLPKSRSGKVITSQIKEHYFNNRDEKSEDINKKIFEIASTHFLIPLEQIDINANPDTISSWDSLGHLEFISLLEDAFSINFTISEMLQIENIKDIIRIIKKKV